LYAAQKAIKSAIYQPVDSDYGLTLKNIIITIGGALLIVVGLSLLLAICLAAAFW
jgi:hypothetical protein